MSTTLDMERIAKELGAERCGKASAHGGYFAALQLAAEVASHSRVSESPPSSNELLKEIGKIAKVQDQVRELKEIVREQRDAIARLERQISVAKVKAAKASKIPAGDKRLDSSAK